MIKSDSNISIISLLNSVMEEASGGNISDIHIDPTPGDTTVRYRKDGVLYLAKTFPKNIHQEIIARIKVLARLRTDEHQAAQDGRFRYTNNEKYVDVRVSIVPTYHGENAVLRLLADYSAGYTLANLGFSENDRKKIEKAIRRPHGMILATGPTGSGKTTTLYTLLKMLSTPEISIITIEDPIEYAMEGVEQIQVNQRMGLSFANGLRSILRQDPNVIMVGEIRDSETARISVNTALTGHLLLSTLHTSNAATTLPRLLDMGIEEYLVASTVSLAIGQRLVRKISKDGSGYSGRISVNEVLVVNDEIREAILRKASASEIHRIAKNTGMTDMLEDGMEKVRLGITTEEEILRVIYD